MIKFKKTMIAGALLVGLTACAHKPAATENYANVDDVTAPFGTIVPTVISSGNLQKLNEGVYLSVMRDENMSVNGKEVALPEIHIDAFDANTNDIYSLLSNVLPSSFEFTVDVKPEKYVARPISFKGGSLTDLMTKLSDTFGIAYSFDGKTMTVQHEKMYSFYLNLKGDKKNPMVVSLEKVMQDLGISKFSYDTSSQILEVSTNSIKKAELEKVIARKLQTTATLAVKMYSFEVNLTENQETGVDLDKFRIGNHFSLTGGNLVSGGLTSTLAFDAKNFNMNAFFSFLSTYGKTKKVNNREFLMVSGEDFVDQDDTFTKIIEEVNVTPTATGSNTNTTSVKATSMETGTKVKMNLAYRGGHIKGDISMKFVTLLDMDTQTFNNQTLKLPKTSSSTIEFGTNSIKPGQVTMLASRISTREVNDDKGFSLGSFLAPTYKSKKVERVQTIVAFAPFVIKDAIEGVSK